MSSSSINTKRVPEGLLYIDGRWAEAADHSTIPVMNPSLGSQIGTIARGGVDDIDRAVRAARYQFDQGEWSRLPASERGILLWRLADLVEEHREHLANLETMDIGRPFGEPYNVEIPSAVETLRYYAGWADKIEGSTMDLPPLGGTPRMSYTLRQPLGVVGSITPWNAPTMITSWKLGPALAAGNTVVLKSAEEASLSTLLLFELIEKAGFPPGVVNLVTGEGRIAGEALVRHPGVNKISFTGSPEVGRHIAAIASRDLKKISLELGGKSPQIVRPDADVDEIIATAGIAIFANQGQTCAAGSRLIIHASIFDEFTEKLSLFAKALRVGDPFDPETQMGTLISQKQLERVTRYVDEGKAAGAELIAGGSRLGTTGYFFEPTLFTSDNDSVLAREEIFGPVGTLIRVADDDEALRLANETSYGLTAVVWSRDIGAINKYVKGLNTGSVWVNAWGVPHPGLPWLGRKVSGLGEDLGRAGLMAYTVEKAVTVVA